MAAASFTIYWYLDGSLVEKRAGLGSSYATYVDQPIVNGKNVSVKVTQEGGESGTYDYTYNTIVPSASAEITLRNVVVYAITTGGVQV